MLPKRPHRFVFRPRCRNYPGTWRKTSSGCKVLILLGVMGKLLLEHAQDQYKVYLVDSAGDPSRVPLAERKDQSKSVST